MKDLQNSIINELKKIDNKIKNNTKLSADDLEILFLVNLIEEEQHEQS